MDFYADLRAHPIQNPDTPTLTDNNHQ